MDLHERFQLERRAAVSRAVADLAADYGERLSVDLIEQLVTDSYDRLAAKSTVLQHLGTLAARHARKRLRALVKAGGTLDDDRPAVLFLCVHNAGRSQMALGWLEHLGGDAVVGYSGGSAPAEQINPVAVEVMAEVGIDITGEYPKPWTEEILRAADVIVLMGCGDSCPVYPGKRYVDWELDDPAGQDLGAVRRIRDDIRGRVEGLLAELGVAAKV